MNKEKEQNTKKETETRRREKWRRKEEKISQQDNGQKRRKFKEKLRKQI